MEIDPLEAVFRYRPQLEAALAHSDGTHTVEDIAALVAEGRAMCWPGGSSVMLTEIIDYPRLRALNFFLAGGTMAELKAMTPLVLEWGRDRGCQRATLLGRRGWQRSFLAKEGWAASPLVMMTREL